jgi:hypothetical protein
MEWSWKVCLKNLVYWNLHYLTVQIHTRLYFFPKANVPLGVSETT